MSGVIRPRPFATDDEDAVSTPRISAGSMERSAGEKNLVGPEGFEPPTKGL